MDNIKTPEDLLEYMSNNIEYGYLGKNGRVYKHDDHDFNDDWESEYVLQGYNDILKTLHGNCFDQVEFEREWFINNNYEVKTFFEMVLLDYKNSYPSHSFLVYKEDNRWCLFENADYNNRGIQKFSSLEDAIKYQHSNYVKDLNEIGITSEEKTKIILREFNKPNNGLSSNEYLEFVINSKEVIL